MRRSTLPLLAAGAVLFAGCTESATDPTAPAPEAPAEQRSPAPGMYPIAQIATEKGFSELVEALAYVDTELDAGLIPLFLEGTDQFTVFAPTNEAFDDLYALLSVVLGAPVTDVTDLPAEVVLDVLFYHVAEGRRGANSVVPKRNVKSITPLLGESFAVRTDLTIEDGLTALEVRDDAQIVAADFTASNGIIHVIDQVIVPPSVVAALTQ